MKKALCVVDLIHQIVKVGNCSEYFNNHPSIIDNINELVEVFSKNQWPIFYIRLAFDKDYTHLPKHGPLSEKIKENKLFQLNTKSTNFIDELSLKKEGIIINKVFGNPFAGNNLAETLKNLQIEDIVLTGFATNNAILFGANHAVENDFKAIVIKDACGANDITSHQTGLSLIESKCTSHIYTKDEFLSHS